ncbi:hypothetical protein D3C87_1667950 [compost metagenome]
MDQGREIGLVVLDPLGAGRRVEGHRHRSGERDAEEGLEKVDSRGKAQHDAIARLEPEGLKGGGSFLCQLPDGPVAQRDLSAAILGEQDQEVVTAFLRALPQQRRKRLGK